MPTVIEPTEMTECQVLNTLREAEGPTFKGVVGRLGDNVGIFRQYFRTNAEKKQRPLIDSPWPMNLRLSSPLPTSLYQPLPHHIPSGTQGTHREFSLSKRNGPKSLEREFSAGSSDSGYVFYPVS